MNNCKNRNNKNPIPKRSLTIISRKGICSDPSPSWINPKIKNSIFGILMTGIIMIFFAGAPRIYTRALAIWTLEIWPRADIYLAHGITSTRVFSTPTPVHWIVDRTSLPGPRSRSRLPLIKYWNDQSITSLYMFLTNSNWISSLEDIEIIPFKFYQFCLPGIRPIKPLSTLLDEMVLAELTFGEYVAICSPISFQCTWSTFKLDFLVSQNEVVLVIGVSLVGQICVQVSILSQIAEKGLRIGSGDQLRFGVKSNMCESTNNLVVL